MERCHGWTCFRWASVRLALRGVFTKPRNKNQSHNKKRKNNDIALIRGDELAKLPEGSVDCVLTDPPYGNTNAGWDKVPDWDVLFTELWLPPRLSATMAALSRAW